jgi:predicted RND superfamily exporter protein
VRDLRDRIERLFAAWGRLAYRRPWLVIGLVLLTVGSLASQLPKFSFDTSMEGFLHEDDPVRTAYDAFRERFGRDTKLLLVIRPSDVFERGSLEKLRALHEEIENEVPKLVEVTSLVNARQTYGVGDELIVGELLEDWPETPEALAEVKRRALSNPLYLNTLISADGRFTTVVIETEAYSSLGGGSEGLAGFDELEEAGADPGQPAPFLTGEENSEIVLALAAVVARHRAPDFEIYMTGTPVLSHELQVALSRDMARFTSLAVLMIAFFLALLFRRVAGVVLPLVTVILALLCTLSMMAITGVPLMLPTQILPSFLLAVGVGHSVHILAIFYQARRRAQSKQEAIAFALGHSGLAVLMTSLTTAGGLFSFVIAELRPIAHLGVFGPIGVLMVLLLTLALLPALVAVFPMREERALRAGQLSRSQRLLVRVGDVATRHAAITVGSWAALLVIAAVGASRLSFAHDPIHWFPDGHDIPTATEIVNSELHGALFLELLIETGEENGLHHPDLLVRMDRIADHAASVRAGDVYVGKTVSLVDVVKEIHQALNENRPEFHAVPDDRDLVAQELLLFENSGSDDLEDFVDSRFSTGRLTMKVPFRDAAQYPALFDEIERGAERILGPGFEFQLTGLGSVIGRMLPAVMLTMARSYAIALVVITPLMVLLIGSLRIGLTSMIPNLAPILLVLGLMGWAGIPLDTFTLMVGSIAIGLAVDDTIHFLHNFRRYHARSGDVPGAVRETLASTGQALLFTSLVLASGFFLYMLASMNNLFYFGLLTGFTIIAAFLADLILAPALMALVIRPRGVEVASALEMEASR